MSDTKRVRHCSHWGAYTILVRGEEIVSIESFEQDPSPSPIIHSVTEWAKPDRRILNPMVRAGWLENGHRSDTGGRGREPFVPVSWDKALELVAGEITRVANTFGNEAIFAGSYGWTSCGRFHHAATQLKRLLNLVGGFTGHVDTYSIAAGPAILRHVLGDSLACDGQANTLDTIAEHTETLLVFGSLSPRTAQNEAGGIGQHSLEGHLKRLQERNVRIVLVSPSKDDLPEWVDAEWWPIRPNADVALMLGLAGEILNANAQDTEFLNRCCSGSETFLTYLRGDKDGLIKDATWASEVTGVPAAQIRSLAKNLVASRSMITVSWSLQRAHHGEQPFWAALGLAALAGKIGLPGGGVGYGYASLGGVGAPFGLIKSPAISAGRQAIKSFIPVARITDMLLNPGSEFSYEGKTYRYPDTKLVYWAGGNPFHHHQDLNRLDQAWLRPETIIVQDPMFTATAMRADILLPASTSIERNDLAASRRSEFIFAMQQAISPLGQSRSDFDIFNSLASHLGVEAWFNEGRDEMEWIRHIYETSREDAKRRFDFNMPDFDRFWSDGYARIPVKSNHTYLKEFKDAPEAYPLKTESGKIVLGSQLLDELSYADCPSHPAWLEPVEWLGAKDIAGKLHLVSHQPAGRLHSQLETGTASVRLKRAGREVVTINTADAARFGLESGCTARLWNPRGECLATVEVTDDVREGVALLPTGAWFTSLQRGGLEISGNPNVLTIDIPTSAFSQGCSAHTCLISIGRYEAEAPDAMSYYQEGITGIAASASDKIEFMNLK